MSETPNPVYDLSFQEQKDVSTDAINYIKLYDVNTGFAANENQDHFHFRCNDINSWYRYAHSFFHFQCSANQSADNELGIVNSDIRSVLNRVVFRVNSEVVEDKPQYFYREAEWDKPKNSVPKNVPPSTFVHCGWENGCGHESLTGHTQALVEVGA